MAQLRVRNLSEDLARALKQRDAKHNRSAEQEHREILRLALRGPRRRPLADVLAGIPNVGEDKDLERELISPLYDGKTATRRLSCNLFRDLRFPGQLTKEYL